MRRALCIAVVLLFVVVLPAAAGGQKFVKPAEKEKCPVCGMFVAKYPDWTAEVLFKDGSHSVFDGPKDLFRFLVDVKQYAPGRSASDVSAVFVQDYYAVKPIDGRKAFYVLGSDVNGPMGRELVAFASEAEARDFLRDHHGKKLLRFHEVTAAVLGELE